MDKYFVIGYLSTQGGITDVNRSKLWTVCKLSITGILEKPLAGRLSRFHIAKDKVFFIFPLGPGLTSTAGHIG